MVNHGGERKRLETRIARIDAKRREVVWQLVISAKRHSSAAKRSAPISKPALPTRLIWQPMCLMGCLEAMALKARLL